MDEADKLTFNWTKVELKQAYISEELLPWQTFNWTKVELKLYEELPNGVLEEPFNWTKVELKHLLDYFW